jgi:small subunit ribosomal protein S19
MVTRVIVSGKERKFRGKSLEELKKLSIREFAILLKSRERRTVLRSFGTMQKFVEKAEKKVEKRKIPKTHMREMVIIPKFVGWTIGVHNGKEYVSVTINEDMLGHRLGEFSQTRRTVKHGSAGVGATKGSASKSVK